jgi:outer membrane protein assembly factor BamB
MGSDDGGYRRRFVVRPEIRAIAGATIVVGRICPWLVSAVSVLLLHLAQVGADETWNQFRGPNGAGVTLQATPPIELTAERLAWSTSIPRGKSSPIIVGSRLFVTATADDRLWTLAIDTDSGRILWQREAPVAAKATQHPAGCPAAPTPCADQQRVYVYFPAYGLLAYDHEGSEVWQKPLPLPENMYGVSTSPILHGGNLILVLDDDGNLPDSTVSRSRIMAIDTITGETHWETPRPFNRGVWTTPMIWTHEHGQEIVVLGDGRAYGYDPRTGEEKWFVSGFSREPIAVPVASDKHLFLSVAMQGGRGDAEIDPEPFWQAVMSFDQDGDGQLAKKEISQFFTLPFRPELPVDHPGFGYPLPSDAKARRAMQSRLFDWRDTNRDGIWTKEEFAAELKVGGGRPGLLAIRPGGSGDITNSHTDWTVRAGIPEIPSPVYFDDHLYLIRDGGILTAIDANDGTVASRDRLAASGQYEASPVIANRHLYLVSALGRLSVVRIGQPLQVVHEVQLPGPVAATPAIVDHTLYVRTETQILAYR